MDETVIANNLHQLLPITLFGFSFLLYLSISRLLSFRDGSVPIDVPAVPSRRGKLLYLRRIIGFLLLGLLPLTVIWFLYPDPQDFGLRWPSAIGAVHLLGWYSIPTLVVLLVLLIRPRRRININHYPELRITEWSTKDIVWNALSWLLYLMGYEFAFRGLLLFSMIEIAGLPYAIATNTLLYSLAHLHKPLEESWGAIPLGIVLSLTAYHTSSVVIPLLLHTLLALGNDLQAIRAHPQMHIVWGKRP